MARDHRFYKRFNFQLVFMEEYEVRDVSHRDEAPDLSLEFYLPDEKAGLEFEDGQGVSKPFALNVIIKNASGAPAMYWRCVHPRRQEDNDHRTR